MATNTYPLTLNHWFTRNISQYDMHWILSFGAGLHPMFRSKSQVLCFYHNFQNDIWEIVSRDIKLRGLPDSIELADRYRFEYKLTSYDVEQISDLKCLIALYVIQQLSCNWYL